MFFTNECDFYLLTVSIMLKRNQRQELLPEKKKKPHFFHLQFQEINALIWTIRSPSYFFSLLVPVSVTKGGRISHFLHRSGCPRALWWLKDPGDIPPWKTAGAHSSLTSCTCVWRLHCCLRKAWEGKTSFSFLCRAASREVWTSERQKDLLPCPARGPFSPDAGHGGHAGGTQLPAAVTWSRPLQENLLVRISSAYKYLLSKHVFVYVLYTKQRCVKKKRECV